MDEIKRASIYLRILWLNDNVKLRPKKLDIKLEGENIENIVFSISEENKNIGRMESYITLNSFYYDCIYLVLITRI